MWKKNYSRREFVKKNSLTGLGALLAMGVAPSLFAGITKNSDVPAILGGQPVRTKAWPNWPVWDVATDEKQVLEVLRNGVWCRVGVKQSVVADFEVKWAETLGARRCLAVVNGTNALIISLRMLDIGGGDEVIVTPYTFVATISAILEVGAMPVFVDIDPETFQIDPKKIEEKITPRTRAILPVHILGLPVDIVRIMEIARKHKLIVVEDACQAWLAEVNHQKVGTFGDAGCFSFQNSKHLAIGEGGAIVSNNDDFMDRCHSYHDCGRAYGKMVDPVGGSYIIRANNLRMTEYQAAIGLAQLKRLEGHTVIRNENAAYLKSQIKDIPGIIPYKLYDNVTRASFHLFPFRYKKELFEGLPRKGFLQALSAEGVPCWGGYGGTLNNMPYLDDAFRSKNYKKMYPREMLDFQKFVEKNKCPENDRICNEEAVWIFQSLLLGSKSDMDDIAAAISKVQQNAGKIKAKM
jgi:dTDP-4-amino-4,6-dideoxygalactose transaminase